MVGNVYWLGPSPDLRAVHLLNRRHVRHEVELFRYLTTITHRPMADDMRTAIRFYARHLPEFSPEAFLAFLKSDAKMSKGPERDQLVLEAEAFAATVARNKSENFDRLSGVGDDGEFTGSAADFDLA